MNAEERMRELVIQALTRKEEWVLMDGEAGTEYFKSEQLRFEAIRRQQELEMMRLMAGMQSEAKARSNVSLLEMARKRLEQQGYIECRT